MPTKIEWRGHEFTQKLDGGLARNVAAAGRVLKAELKKVLSVPGRTVTESTSPSGKTRRKYGALGSAGVSAPGEAPRKQTGRLVRTLFSKLSKDRKSARVGANGYLMEFGTRTVKPRPWLRNTFERLRGQIAAIICRRID